MDESSYIFQLIAGVLFLAAGAQLLRLSLRTRETPERLLGIYFLASGFSLLGWLTPEIFHLESMANRINFVLWFDLIPWALYDVGMIAFLLFARMTFRPNAAWSKWIVATCILLLFLSLTMWFIQDVENYSIENPWFWCQWAGYTLPQLWITIEAFRNYSGARRRARIGLCDLVVVNRYLLFGCYGVVSILGCCSELFSATESSYQGASAEIDFAMGILELGGIALLFLIFCPPTFYQRWIAAETEGKAVGA
jgi:hypothetical protein